MLSEKNLFEGLKNLFFSLSLLSLTVFIAFGNLPRVIESPLFSDHLLLSEILLYFFSLCSLFFIRASSKSKLTLSFVCLLVMSSFFYGCLLQGFDLHAALYAIRLIALCIASFSLTYICLEKFQGSIFSFFSFLSKGYGISLILGFFFFLFFFSTDLLWKELSLYHILFHGDPHRGRFVSVYFDPNYYAAIVGMPLLMTQYLYQKTRKKAYALLFCFFGLSALLTWSRSGIFLLVLLFFLLVFFPIDRRGLSQKKLKGVLFFFSIICSMALLFLEEMKIFIIRLFFLMQDESALSRFYTFEWGIAFWKKSPLFGVGYNFLHGEVKQEIGLNSLDSSLLSLFIQIGAIPFLCLFLYGLYKVPVLRRKILLCKEQEKEMGQFFVGFLLYGFLIVFFASHFNQLLFYPFWALPFTVIFLFLMKAIKNGPERDFFQVRFDSGEDLT